MSEESKKGMSRRDFLKAAGVATVAAATGAFRPEIEVGGKAVAATAGRVAREAGEGFEQWKYGKTAVRIDELSISREQLQIYLDGIKFNSFDNPTLQEVHMSVVKMNNGENQVSMAMGEEVYDAVPVSGTYIDKATGETRTWQGISWLLRTTDGSEIETFPSDTLVGGQFRKAAVFALAQGVNELTGSSDLTVYLGVGQTENNPHRFATPLDGEGKASFFAVALDKDSRERIYKGSITNTGPFGLNPKNVGAEGIKTLP